MADTQGIRAGRAYVELGIGDRLTAGLKAAQARLKAFGEGATKWGTRILAAGSAVAAPAMAASKVFASMGDEVAKASKRTGISTEALSELGYAAQRSGTDFGTMEGGVRKMQKAISAAAGGSKQAADALAQIGLSAAALKGLSPEDQFTVIGEAISRITDPTERAAAAMKIFGKSGTSLLPMFEKGAAGLGAMREEARGLGLSISGKDAAAAERLTDGFGRLWGVFKGLAFAVGAALAPAMSDLLEKGASWASTAITWLRENSGLVLSLAQLAAGVVAAGAAIVGIGKAASVFSAVFGVAASVVGALLSPIGMVVAAVGALGGYLLYATGAGGKALDWLSGRFAELKADAIAAWGGIAGALAGGDIGLAAKILWLTLKMEWTRGASWLAGIWNDAMTKLSTIAVEAWYGLRIVLTGIWHGLEVAWIETTAFLSKVWTNFCAGIHQAWLWVSKSLEETWNHVKGAFDENFNADAANAAVEQQYGKARDDMWNQAKAQLGEREAERARQREESKKDYDKTVAGLVDQGNAKKKQLQDEHDQKMKASEDELAAARKEWDAAVAAGKKKGEDAAKGAAGPGKLADPKGLLDRIGAAAGGLQDRVMTSLGTFNAARLQGMGPSDALNRTAAACEKTAKNTQKLVDQGEDEFE